METTEVFFLFLVSMLAVIALLYLSDVAFRLFMLVKRKVSCSKSLKEGYIGLIGKEIGDD